MNSLRVWLFAFLVFTASIGGCVGGLAAARFAADDGAGVIYAPLPHHVAPSPDSASFRFTMVHDIIHERYPRHGQAFYQERDRLARDKLAVLHPDSVTAFALTDDIAVGLDRRGRTDEAIGLMRDKLKRQHALGLQENDLYSTYANLGQFLVHANLWAMMSGAAEARERVEEGRDLIRKSMEVNPEAHFGLETWHLVVISFLLDASYHLKLLRNCDLIGNRLDRKVEFIARQKAELYDKDSQEDLARAYAPFWVGFVEMRGWTQGPLPDTLDPEMRKFIRDYVAEVGGERMLDGSRGAGRGKRAPFDEPALWLIGEWRQGSGPNPHYALCLGEIMLRVGQRYIAWNCFERASRMAEQFWPTPELQQVLRDHCRVRQAAIEQSLPADEAAGLRPKFEAELALGENYQREYQEYEEEKIRSGANLNDEHFYDEFHATHQPIASKIGSEEWYAGSTEHTRVQARFRAFCEWGLFAGGATLLLTSLVLRFFIAASPPSSPRQFVLRSN